MGAAFATTIADFINAVVYAAWFTLAVFICWFAWASWDLTHTEEEKAEAWKAWRWFRPYQPRHMRTEGVRA